MNSLPHEPPLGDLAHATKKFLAGIRFPHGPFNPAGNWKQSWAIWLRRGNSPEGYLQLQKTLQPDGTFDLKLHWKLRQTTKGFQQLLATIACAGDRLATPRSWQAQSDILDHAGSPIQDLTVKKNVKVTNGVLELSGGRRRFAADPLKTWTSNWSLMEAIPRLGGQAIAPLTFTLLDFLDERKDGHELSYLGPLVITLGGRAAHLQGYQLMGPGILPMEYWLDEQGRLVILLGHERCLLANPEDVNIETIGNLQGHRA